MYLDQLFILVERLRKEAIGEPNRIDEKKVYEYQDHSAKVVAVLKIIRAAQGLTALELLRRRGLFIDFGVIFRCVYDCQAEVYFLLEGFPNTSGNVDQFVKSFFESTIDGHLSKETSSVPTKKIRSANVRFLKDRPDEETRTIMDNIYKTCSGYVHANYAHIMEMYNGQTIDFSLHGVPDLQQRQVRIEHVELAANMVRQAAAFVAHTLGLKDLYHDFLQCGHRQTPVSRTDGG
jgi:hypothetical protein